GPSRMGRLRREHPGNRGERMMKRLYAAALTACVTAILTAAPAAARTLTLADLRGEIGVADPKFSPDGRSVVIVTSKSDFDANVIKSNLVLIDIKTGAQHTLTHDRG